MSHTPLSDADYQRLAAILNRFLPQQGMNLERLDGFFAALLSGPEPIKPTECLPIIIGEAFDDDSAFPSDKSLEQFAKLLMGHWLDISAALRENDAFQPWLEQDAAGELHGNDWAEGFSEGMQLLNEDWGLLFDDPEHAPLLEPILTLAFERNPDPEVQVPALTPTQREQCLSALSESVHGIHRFFAAIRRRLEEEEQELERRQQH